MRNILKLKYLLMFLIVSSFIFTSCDDDEGNALPSNVFVGFEGDTTTVQENDANGTITVRFEAAAPVSGTLTFGVNNLTASASDYSLSETISNGQFTVAVSEGAESVSFNVIPVDNDVIDSVKQVEVTLISATDGIQTGDFSLSHIIVIQDDDGAPALKTIAEIRALYADTDLGITSNLTIEGVVTSVVGNTSSQNVVLQDASAGIVVRFQESHSFQRGDLVEVSLFGDTLTNFNDLVQVEVLDIATAVKIGTSDLPAYQTVTIAELNASDAYESELVQIENVEFEDAGDDMSGNANITDGSNTAVVRTNSGASFSSETQPSGTGTVRGIAGVFRGTNQINPQVFAEDIFPASTGGGTGNTIASIRAMYSGSDMTISDDLTIEAVVISVVGNTSGQNIVLQDATAGIVIRFTEAHSFVRGDLVEVSLQNGTLTDFNDLVQVEDIALTAASKTGTSDLPAYQTVTIAQLNASADYESELVQIENVEFENAGNAMSGNANITDGSNTTIVRTNSGATFTAELQPSGTGTVRGIGGVFRGDNQIYPQIFDEDIFPVTSGGGTSTIASIRSMYSGSDMTVSDDLTIEAVVISVVGNTNNQNIVLQDATAGIVVRFTAEHTFQRGDLVEVSLQNGTLTDFNDLVQVENLALTAATKKGTSDLPAYQTVTIAQLNASTDYESELIQIVNVEFENAGSNMSGNANITDGANTTIVRTNSSAPFTSETQPSGTGTVRGIGGVFRGSNQIYPQVFSEDIFP